MFQKEKSNKNISSITIQKVFRVHDFDILMWEIFLVSGNNNITFCFCRVILYCIFIISEFYVLFSLL
ncbi:hypothetical protein NITUZ_40599 [Candidatus Nitrosotenuis uzonensis]|uniref:Uncharacterized protein n=1 Tax=Candidatus Nitrosotenuis uzonensis TaxID=1407055 RepID=V6AVB5_9ARCH|nr:hypothetical protein NITUZ_40599 [Candidatus Nitrosotenuis uzonensis]